MKIFDESKTYELSPETIDYSKGELINDKRLVMHHKAIEAKEAVYANREEILSNGSKQIWKDLVTPAIEAKDAYDEYEDIQLYVPYTCIELLNMLRAKRTFLLDAFDKWEKAVLRGREQDDYSIMIWYQDLLDLENRAFENVPERIKYYLQDA